MTQSSSSSSNTTSGSLSITSSSLPSGATGATYSATLQASGGTAPYGWSLTGGQLPPGVGLTSSGQISGTPTTQGTYSFSVQASDSSGSTETATANESIRVSSSTLDAYGGRTDVQCGGGATGWFYTQKVSNRWWFCDPLGNAFFANGIFVIDRTENGTTNGSQTYANAVLAKYGSVPAWANEELVRLTSWGFNLIGDESSAYVKPYATDSSYPVDAKGLHSIPTKAPFLAQVRASYYSMSNPAVFTKNYSNAALLPAGDAVKNIFTGVSAKYTGYIPGGGVGDYYDTNMYTWLANDVSGSNEEMVYYNLQRSPYQNYLLGFVTDDSDEMYGFGAGPDFATVPAGHNNANLSWIVATASPEQTASSQKGQVYNSTEVYTKQAWANYLQGKYGTISVLNNAWGSSYTTFGSSGTAITGETVGSGNGSATSFTHTLAHSVASKFSVQVLVGGKAVGGDLGNGTIWGPSLTGTISYTTGALSLTFSTAPASGAAVTVNYEQNGWGIGSGVLDEDGSGTWLGTDPVYLSNANASTAADLNAFLKDMAAEYFSNCAAAIHAAFPHALYFGPDSLGSWSGPPSKYVLQGVAPYIDGFIAGNSRQVVYTQSEIDYIETNFGDKPYLATNFSVANPDSALSAYTNSNEYSTQGARGQAYLTAMEAMWNAAATSNGAHPYIGMIWWRFGDDWAEHENWGLVTNLDNAYDGHEAVKGSVSCSAPLQQYSCGGEAGNYGDLIGPVKQANAYWLTH